ncbi:hypothetical protein MN116_004183 [Schistosoma mekongi]|uniref:tRNA (cytosine(34)-C(5))-methyltransferase n=1 Tax=Schistosoma mekongi TaxID=38744 RepID=A0AAE1ZF93_SCHME|nr:hypothetical protein MN116_004183 [Schistosoma mekongi]
MGLRRPTTKCRQHIKLEMKQNESFEKYYRSQGIVPEDEWEDFISCLKRDLPITFRVTGFRDQNKELLRLIKQKFRKDIFEMKHYMYDENDQTNGTFEPLSWYPNQMAWQLSASKYAVRKTEELRTLQQFLVSETESGNISRQEAVSMLPPLLLDIRSHHTILDLCAAPGSKSAQLVELLHSDAEAVLSRSDSESAPKYIEPTGMVIANDVDQRRCYMMVHQVKRLQSPCVVITQEDASCFPRLYLTLSSDEKIGQKDLRQLVFDRVLADVPCSGDGTLRKNPDLWLRWSPNLGIGEHPLQCRILKRGLELLRDPVVDSTNYSRLVYSTCSFNPVENEAVVASILQACRGAVRLIEPELLECILSDSSGNKHSNGHKFKARLGLSSWRVMDKKGVWFTSYDEVPAGQRNHIYPSLFPPSNVADLHLERCRRVLPHDQNTGGFFIAVLEKIAPLPWMNTTKREISVNDNKISQTESQCEEKNYDSRPPHVAKKSRIFHENGFTYLDSTLYPIWSTIRDYYKIQDRSNYNSASSSKLFCADNLLSRLGAEGNHSRFLYYTNSLVKNMLSTNIERGVKIINTGVRMFSTVEDKQFEGYRLLQDGIEVVDAYIPFSSDRRVHLTPNEYCDLVLLLEYEMPLLSLMTESTRRQCENISPGPVLIDYTPNNTGVTNDDHSWTSDSLPHCRLVFAGWRGAKSLRHYIGRFERLHFMRLANVEPRPCITGHTANELLTQENPGPNEDAN